MQDAAAFRCSLTAEFIVIQIFLSSPCLPSSAATGRMRINWPPHKSGKLCAIHRRNRLTAGSIIFAAASSLRDGPFPVRRINPDLSRRVSVLSGKLEDSALRRSYFPYATLIELHCQAERSSSPGKMSPTVCIREQRREVRPRGLSRVPHLSWPT